MTRIEELEAELEREIQQAISPLRDIEQAARNVSDYVQMVFNATQRLAGYRITDAILKTNATETRALLYFLNERIMREWSNAVRAFSASALSDSLSTIPISCPYVGKHLREKPCVVCGELLNIASISGAGGGAGAVVVEVTSR